MKTPVNARTLKQHITYNWWKYLLIALISFGVVDLLYAVTTYRPPREKVLGFYVYGYLNEPDLTAWLEDVRVNEFPEMEEISCLQVMDDDTYGPMQLMAYLSAGEGDIFLLPREQFLGYASSGALVPLENDAELMAMFDAAGVSLQSGWRRNTETGETHLCGIPQDKLPGLSRYAFAKDGFLCVIDTAGKADSASRLLRVICRDNLNP